MDIQSVTCLPAQVRAERASKAADTLLNNLELYSYPRQGHGSWPFPDEAPLADELATKLHATVSSEPLENWVHSLIHHTLWQSICSDARNLIPLIS